MNNRRPSWVAAVKGRDPFAATAAGSRSEEHTSELQSQSNLVCRLLLEKKKKSLCPDLQLYLTEPHFDYGYPGFLCTRLSLTYCTDIYLSPATRTRRVISHSCEHCYFVH